MTKFEVRGKRILVQEPDKMKVTDAGILLPETAEPDPRDVKNWYCEVIGVGDKLETEVIVGQVVVIDPTVPYVGFLHPDSNRPCMFITQDQILAIVKNK